MFDFDFECEVTGPKQVCEFVLLWWTRTLGTTLTDEMRTFYPIRLFIFCLRVLVCVLHMTQISCWFDCTWQNIVFGKLLLLQSFIVSVGVQLWCLLTVLFCSVVGLTRMLSETRPYVYDCMCARTSESNWIPGMLLQCVSWTACYAHLAECELDSRLCLGKGG